MSLAHTVAKLNFLSNICQQQTSTATTQLGLPLRKVDRLKMQDQANHTLSQMSRQQTQADAWLIQTLTEQLN